MALWSTEYCATPSVLVIPLYVPVRCGDQQQPLVRVCGDAVELSGITTEYRYTHCGISKDCARSSERRLTGAVRSCRAIEHRRRGRSDRHSCAHVHDGACRPVRQRQRHMHRRRVPTCSRNSVLSRRDASCSVVVRCTSQHSLITARHAAAVHSTVLVLDTHCLVDHHARINALLSESHCAVPCCVRRALPSAPHVPCRPYLARGVPCCSVCAASHLRQH